MSWQVDLLREYQLRTGNRDISTLAVADWALVNGKYKSDPIDERARLATKLAWAFRQEHFTDPQGRRVRLLHAVSNREGQTKMTFWHDMRTVSPEDMKRAMQQRREQSLADNFQMKMDCDSYNENYNSGEPIQMIFDYTVDLAEKEAVRLEIAPKSA